MSILIFNSSTYSDIESTNDSNSTKSADEGDGVFEIPDDETCFGDDVDVPSGLEHVEATIPIISYGPHYKLSRGEEVLAVMKWYRIQNLSAHLACFLQYLNLGVRCLGVLLYQP